MEILYWILCIVIGVIPAWIVWTRDRKSANKYRIIPSILRGLAFFTIAMLLLAPAFKWESHKTQRPKVILLQDNSTSFAKGLGNQQSKYEENRSELISKLSEYDVISYAFGGSTEKSNEYDYTEKATDIDQAINTISQKYKNANLGAIILASDGIYNQGANPAYMVANQQSPIYTIGVGDSSEVTDIMVLRVFANKVVMVGNPFEVAVDIKFAKLQNTNHTISLSNGSSTLQTKSVSIEGTNQVISTAFEIKPTAPGIYKYTVSVPTVAGEKSAVNNKMDFFVQVVDNKAKVLVLNNGTHPDIGYIRNALKSTVGYEVIVASPNTLPEDISSYKTIIAHQPQLTAAQWDRINATQIPTWHILGLQTTATQTAAIKQHFTASVGTIALHTPRFQNTFATFKLPLSAAGIINKLPPLESNISSASSLIKSSNIIKSGDKGSDMWMIHNAQMPMAVTVGEGIWRWGVYEYKDHKSNAITHELIQQTVRILNVPKVDKPFQVFLSKKLITDNESINFAAELRNKSGQLVNDAVVNMVIRDQDGKQYEYTFDKLGEAYALTVAKLSQGTYQYIASVSNQGSNFTDQGTFVVESIPLEELNTQADFPLLYQMAHSTGASFHGIDNMISIADAIHKNQNIKSRIITEKKNDPFISYPWLFFIILSLLSIEWLLRKYFNMQ